MIDPLSIFPNEISSHMLAFVKDDQTYATLCRVSKHWKKVTEQTWKEFSKERGLLRSEKFWINLGIDDWKWVYKYYSILQNHHKKTKTRVGQSEEYYNKNHDLINSILQEKNPSWTLQSLLHRVLHRENDDVLE